MGLGTIPYTLKKNIHINVIQNYILRSILLVAVVSTLIAFYEESALYLLLLLNSLSFGLFTFYIHKLQKEERLYKAFLVSLKMFAIIAVSQVAVYVFNLNGHMYIILFSLSFLFYALILTYRGLNLSLLKYSDQSVLKAGLQFLPHSVFVSMIAVVDRTVLISETKYLKMYGVAYSFCAVLSLLSSLIFQFYNYFINRGTLISIESHIKNTLSLSSIFVCFGFVYFHLVELFGSWYYSDELEGMLYFLKPLVFFGVMLAISKVLYSYLYFKNKTMNISIASLLWLISHFFLSYISSIGILSIPLVFYYSSLMYLTFTILVVLYEYKKA